MVLLAITAAFGIVFLIDLPLILNSKNRGRLLTVYMSIVAAGITVGALYHFKLPINPTIIIESIVRAITAGVIRL